MLITSRLHIWLSVLLVISGCSQPNPFNIRSDGAPELENSLVKRGSERTSLLFFMVDGRRLKEGFFKARTDMTYVIPPGDRRVIIECFYAPNGYWAIGGGTKLYYAPAMVTINAQPNGRYRIGTEIDGTESLRMWVEDVDGARVSETRSKELVPMDAAGVRFQLLGDLLAQQRIEAGTE